MIAGVKKNYEEPIAKLNIESRLSIESEGFKRSTAEALKIFRASSKNIFFYFCK